MYKHKDYFGGAEINKFSSRSFDIKNFESFVFKNFIKILDIITVITETKSKL